MAHQDRRWNPRGEDRDSGRRFGRTWNEDPNEGRDDNSMWGRHQPRQGGDFEERYSGRGGSEGRGSERQQRGEWRGESYGRGRYENDDYLRSGGSYGGQYEDADDGRFYSPNAGSSPRDFGRSQYGTSYQSARDQRGYGYENGREQNAQRGRDLGLNAYDWRERSRNNDLYGQGYGSRSYESSDRYGGDYSLAGSGLSGQWERGYGEMARGTSAGFYARESAGERSSNRDYGPQSSWAGGMERPQRQSFRGKGPKGYERSDERLKEIICERLMEDPEIDASEISVEVRNREVTLQGTVDDRRTKYEVEELIERCGGVKDVKNELRVRSRSSESGDTTSQAAGSSASNYGTSGMSGLGSGSGSGSTSSSGAGSTSSGAGSTSGRKN